MKKVAKYLKHYWHHGNHARLSALLTLVLIILATPVVIASIGSQQSLSGHAFSIFGTYGTKVTYNDPGQPCNTSTGSFCKGGFYCVNNVCSVVSNWNIYKNSCGSTTVTNNNNLPNSVPLVCPAGYYCTPNYAPSSNGQSVQPISGQSCIPWGNTGTPCESNADCRNGNTCANLNSATGKGVCLPSGMQGQKSGYQSPGSGASGYGNPGNGVSGDTCTCQNYKPIINNCTAPNELCDCSGNASGTIACSKYNPVRVSTPPPSSGGSDCASVPVSQKTNGRTCVPATNGTCAAGETLCTNFQGTATCCNVSTSSSSCSLGYYAMYDSQGICRVQYGCGPSNCSTVGQNQNASPTPAYNNSGSGAGATPGPCYRSFSCVPNGSSCPAGTSVHGECGACSSGYTYCS